MIPQNTLNDYKCDALKVINLKLIDTIEEIDDSNIIFHPEMAHQLFGESETIFGYKYLNINICYFAGSLTTYLDIKYKQKIKDLELKPDDIEEIISDKIPSDYFTDLNLYKMQQSVNDSFLPYGKLINSFENLGKTYEVYMSDIKIDNFAEYYSHLQLFMLWYVDAASYIDLEDEKWRFLFCKYEKKLISITSEDDINTNSTKQDKKFRYHINGWTNTYEYYAYPNKVRPRISQFLILPPYQRQGLGCKLLQTIYNFYTPHLGEGKIANIQNNVMDITVETPSLEFVCLRDFVDTKNTIKLISNNTDYQDLLSDFIKDKNKEQLLLNNLKNDLKLNIKQAQKVMEILCMKYIKEEEGPLDRYEIYLKSRITKPLIKENEKLNKLKHSVFTVLDLNEQVNQIYNNTIEHYETVIDKLQKYLGVTKLCP